MKAASERVPVDAAATPVFTIERHWHARWWQVPWLWLRRKPRHSTIRYSDCVITSMEYDAEGGLSVAFDFGSPSE